MIVVDILYTAASWLWKAYLGYFSLCFLVSFASVYQEYKIWAPESVPSLSLWGMFKVYAFNVVWTTTSLLASTLLFPKYILTGGNVERDAVLIERHLAYACLYFVVGDVVIKNGEKLPPDEPGSPAPVYICNHASQIDVGAVYYIQRRFKWIAKASVRMLPGVGQIMSLSKHVFIDRKTGKNKGSVSNLYEKSNSAVQSGCPMFFFPQGTRRMAERLPFKDGALNVALKNKSDLVPLSMEIPLGIWNQPYPLWGKPDPVVITVHDPIHIKGDENKDELRKKCCDIIYGVLPDHRPENKKER